MKFSNFVSLNFTCYITQPHDTTVIKINPKVMVTCFHRPHKDKFIMDSGTESCISRRYELWR
jgi:hypothetical protein